MDLASLIGVVAAFALLLWSILMGGSILLFWDTPSVIMVGGGSIFVTLMCFTVEDVKDFVKVMMRAFLFKARDPKATIATVIEFSTIARKNGLLALESEVKKLGDPFLVKGVQLVIDGFAADTIREILEVDLDNMRARHSTGKKMLETMGTYAPAFGMIGTLVGLVQMLANMSDPSAIGSGMAVALLTTFYGAVAANVVFLPLASKLDVRSKQESQINTVIIEGIILLQKGEKPVLIKQKLGAFVSPRVRAAITA
ncbi:MAG: MotA/TolQ/ExbB proton channel family protein [Planctomycetes bacterium]|nr:MotA/TolQ/ExbB proton channel family protein [Planctomycetota bacterium]